MAQTILALQAELRTILGKKVNASRREGKIPAVLYGHNIKPEHLFVDGRTFEKLYKQAGASTLIDLNFGGKEPIKVLIHEVTPHHLTLKPIHIDFYQVSMTEKLTAKIPLKFVGEAPAVKELGGVLVKNSQTVEVECLPQDLVHEIEVDISQLKTFTDHLTVASLKVPAGITLKDRPEEVIALVQEPKQEEEVVVAPSEAEAIAKIEKVVPEKKADEEEGEGEKKEEKKKEEKKK